MINSCVYPGGNWIRFMAAKAGQDGAASGKPEAASSRLARALESAVVMGDSHGSHVRAAQILDSALERYEDTASAADLLQALAYRAELALRADDTAAADDALARAGTITLSEAERDELTETLAGLEDLSTIVRPAGA